MALRFTPEQQKVIDYHNRNILVSAAAGSGKTAVLVERIVNMVAGSMQIDIDRLLVVTFTNAAAAEMRERIREALLAKLAEDPENAHLQKQTALIHNAQITTISSFCLFILRNHFQDIGLDPGFRVADEGELKLLKQEVLGEVLEKAYASGEEEFLLCAETFGTAGNDRVLEETVLRVFEFSNSFPWPEQWLSACMDSYLEDHGCDQEADWMNYLIADCREQISDVRNQLENALSVCREPDGPYPYLAALEQEAEQAARLLECGGFDEYVDCFGRLHFDRLPSKKDESINPEKREAVKQIRSQAKDCLTSLKNSYFLAGYESANDKITRSSRSVRALLRLVLEFSAAFAQKKQDKNLVDFSDMEHFALRIFLDEKDGVRVPTKTALSYREYFREILIDEYQDSNLVQEYLLQSISGEDTGHFNRFMVGDVKQSIYRFRLARPELFLEKLETYEIMESCLQRIDLSQNFRSRREVLEGVNFLFRQLMGSSVGGIRYDDRAALYPAADYEESEPDDYLPELLLTAEPEDGEGEELTEKEAEAGTVAMRIRQIVGSFPVTDKETGKLRPARYGDIVILLRSNTGWDEVFRKILTEEGIPVHITSRTGYFAVPEVRLILNFVRILDNPYQDIPLSAVLLSELFEFTEEELARIRSEGTEKKFYACLKEYADRGSMEALRTKAVSFLEHLGKYRSRVPYTPIRELLQQIIGETELDRFLAAMPGGEQRKANVEMLLEKALRFEQTSYHGLFHFIRYMEQMEKYNIDFGEANIADENADTVRIMSIHKSKGLEFPIAIVAGLSKRFNKMDTRKALIMDMDLGIGMDFVDPVRRVKGPTLRKKAITRKIEVDNLGEELRILYVALTRAKEKLILSGYLKDADKKREAFRLLADRKEDLLPFSVRAGSSSFLDWILAALARQEQADPLLPYFRVILIRESNRIGEKIAGMIGKELLQQHFTDGMAEQRADRRLLQIMEERFAFQYPFTALQKLYTKTTVSELKKAGAAEEKEASFSLFQEEEVMPYPPRFLRREEEISGAGRGSAYHKILELWKFESPETPEEVWENLRGNGRIPEAYWDTVSQKKLNRFLDSDLARRMCLAAAKGKLYKEQPFVIAVAANRIREEFPDTQSVLVQGIIDVYFEEEDGLVVADYKTDRVREAAQLVSRYQVQLDYYAQALTQLTGKPVKEKIIYSFGLETEVKLPGNG